MKGYTSKTDIENYILKTIDVTFDTQIQAWIEAMENYIDNLTGRNFIADSVDGEKVYDGENLAEQRFDDFVELTKLEIDDVEIDEDDYYLYPSNSVRKDTIELDNGVFYRGKQNIKLTGKFGYSVDVPADIKLATTILVAGIINYSEPSNGKLQSVQVGQYKVAYLQDKDWQDFKRVEQILNSYKRFNF